MSKRGRAVVLAVALMACSAAAGAVEMEVTPGFGGVCKAGAWTPVTLRMKNPSDGGISGAIAAVDPISQQPFPHQTAFDLPGSSQKQYTHYMYMDKPLGTLSIRLLIERGSLPRGSKGEAQCTIAPVQEGGLLVVVIGPARAALSFLTGESLRVDWPAPTGPVAARGTLPRTAPIFAALVDPSMIPDRPLGFDGADMVVLSGFAPGRADPKQLMAIRMWAASGGTLVVNGGPDFQRLQNSFYADMLPVDVTGATEVDALPALEAVFKPSLQPGKVAVTVGRLRADARALYSQGGLPLISERAYGLGRVYFLAFDYSSFPMRGWDGQVAMWKQVMRSTETRWPVASPSSFLSDTMMSGAGIAFGVHWTGLHPKSPGYTSGYGYQAFRASNSIDQIAGNVPSVTAPSIEVILLFLLGYLMCLVPANYFLLTRKKRRELAWVTTPIIIFAFTIGAYGIGYAMKGGKLLLKTVTVVEAGPSSKLSSVTTYAGLFSPSRRTYSIEIADPRAVVSETPLQEDPSHYGPYGGYPGHSGSKLRPDIRVLTAETTRLPDTDMDMWSMRIFRVESACDLGGSVSAELRHYENRGRLVGTIRNDTGYDLRDCMIAIGNKAADIPNIGRKSEAKVDVYLNARPAPAPKVPGGVPPAAPALTIPPPVGAVPKAALTGPYRPPADEVESALESEVAGRLDLAPGEVALIGWSNSSPTQIRLRDGGEERKSANCFVFRLNQSGIKSESGSAFAPPARPPVSWDQPGRCSRTNGIDVASSAHMVEQIRQGEVEFSFERMGVVPATGGGAAGRVAFRDLQTGTLVQADKVELVVGAQGRGSIHIFCYNYRRKGWDAVGSIPSNQLIAGRAILRFTLSPAAPYIQNGKARARIVVKQGPATYIDASLRFTGRPR